MIIVDHAIYNLALLGRLGKERRRRVIAAILAGAAIPDLATAAYFVFYRFVAGFPAEALWGGHYEGSAWDIAANYLHALPIAAAFVAVALVARARIAGYLFGSWLLHAIADFVTHHSDAHPQLLPFTDWVFRSPVSYWEAAYHGALVGTIEIAGALVLLAVFWRKYRSNAARAAIAASAVILGAILIGNAFGGALCPPVFERLACAHDH